MIAFFLRKSGQNCPYQEKSITEWFDNAKVYVFIVWVYLRVTATRKTLEI